jgi:hypothetical protein
MRTEQVYYGRDYENEKIHAIRFVTVISPEILFLNNIVCHNFSKPSKKQSCQYASSRQPNAGIERQLTAIGNRGAKTGGQSIAIRE